MKLNEYELKRLKKERMEEIDKWLDNEYGMSYTRLEELHDYFFEKYTDQKEEIERLNNIINETRKGLDRFYKEHSRLMWTEEDYIEFINCIDRELKGDSSNE